MLVERLQKTTQNSGKVCLSVSLTVQLMTALSIKREERAKTEGKND
jgi:hypothetical protein